MRILKTDAILDAVTISATLAKKVQEGSLVLSQRGVGLLKWVTKNLTCCWHNPFAYSANENLLVSILVRLVMSCKCDVLFGSSGTAAHAA